MDNVISSAIQAIVGLALIAAAALLGSGCGVTPTPTQQPVVTVSCTWNAAEGAAFEDNDCLVDRPQTAGSQNTTGNQVDVPVDAQLDSNVGIQ